MSLALGVIALCQLVHPAMYCSVEFHVVACDLLILLCSLSTVHSYIQTLLTGFRAFDK